MDQEPAPEVAVTASRAARHGPRGPGLRAGWGRALAWGLLAAAGSAAMAELMAFLAAAAARGPGPRPALTARLGGALFLWFNHAGVVFESAGGGSGAFRFTVAVAVLGGTLAAILILVRGGRAVGTHVLDAGGRSGIGAGLHAMRIGPVYALAVGFGSLAVRFTVDLPTNPVVPPSLRVHGSTTSAFLWPLALGLAASCAGGLGAARGWRLPERRWERLARGALAGGWRMLVVGLGLSFGGLLVLAAIHPSLTEGYLNAVFQQGALVGITLVALNVLVVPNMAAWVLFPSMGSCLALAGRASACLLSYRHFPTGAGPAGVGNVVAVLLPSRPSGPAPAAYLLFLVVPAVATILGGVHAAARARPASRAEAAAVGAAAGIAFGLLCAMLAALASVAGSVDVGLGGSAGSSFRLGPELLLSVVLAVAWGAVGGTLGAMARGPERDVEPAETTEGATGP